MFSRRQLVFAALFIYGNLFSLSLSAQVQVSTSIRPLQLLAAAITDGVSEPVLILGASQSPHHAALKPSQRRALAQADLLLWVGPTMEASLSKVVVGLDARVITALELDGIEKQPLRNGVDPHLWLNTDNAGVIASNLAEELSALDAGNSDKYQQNLIAFEAELENLKRQIQEQISQQNIHAYGVYHNAFQYYEEQFGLQHVVSFTDDEELKPGIRKRLNIKETLEQSQVSCLLVEPSVNTEELASFLDNEAMRYVSVDVLGANVQVAKSAYSEFMLSLTDAVLECLR